MRTSLIIVLVCCLTAAALGQKIAPRSPDRTAVSYAQRVLQGFSMRMWLSNQMAMGVQAWDVNAGPEIPGDLQVGLEYPRNSGIEHLFGAGPWVGGIVNGMRRVTEGFNGSDAGKYFVPDQRHPLREKIWFTSTNNLNEPNRRGVDDDGDGKIDEDELDGLDNDGDWVQATDDVGADGIPDPLESGCRGPYDALTNPDPADDDLDTTATDVCHAVSGVARLKDDPDRYTEKNGIPDHGEPHVDEDYGAVSESDYLMSAADTVAQLGHAPTGLKMIQKSYAWSTPKGEAILPMEYTVVNIGHDVIRDVYLSFYVDADIGPTTIPAYSTHNYVCYFESLRTAYSQNPVDRGSTPLGLALLSAPKPLDSLKYIFRWFDFTTPNPGTLDSIIYGWMSGGEFPAELIRPCQDPAAYSDTRFFVSFGPFDELRPGDSLRYAVAFVSGVGIDAGPGSLKENVERSIILAHRSFHMPKAPPSPALRLTSDQKSVTLDWSGDPGPLAAADPYDPALEALPDTHWRRINIPGGRGGRTFEGFKVWRSSSAGFDSASFVELARYDVADDLGLGAQTGLRYSFTDSSVAPGRSYWYAVTSYAVPGRYRMPVPGPDSAGFIPFEMSGEESSLRENATRANVGYVAASTRDEVLVVPNPYRADNRYPGGEGVPMFENAFKGDNGLIWFIHVPSKAKIRIFSLAGDIIATIEHDDAKRAAAGLFTGQEEWRILSESGLPLTSGIYVFSVESDLGTQIGKFVILR